MIMVPSVSLCVAFAWLTQSSATVSAPAPITHADLQRVQASVDQFRAKLREDQKTGVPASRAENAAKTAEFTQEALRGIDAKRIPGEDAADWAALFTTAGLVEPATALEEKALDLLQVRAMFAEVDLLNNLIAAGRTDEAYDVVRHTMNWQGSQIGMLGESLMGAAKRKGLDKTNPKWVYRCLDTLATRLETGNVAAKIHGNEMSDFAYVDIRMKALETRYASGEKDAAVEGMKALKKRFATSASKNAFGQSPDYRVDEFFNQVNAVGQPAPAISYDNSIGGFAGLPSLKGKVVLLDFMAHWCGPCKAELPKIKALSDKFGPSGLQVVSVTSYYGYFGSDQGLSRTVEFARMHDFVKTFSMTWPVVFDPKQQTQASYHVGSIPHVVLIDRKGLIRKVEIGNTPENEAEIQALVQQMVRETP